MVLVTIDTLRADHVGLYGDAGARTPVLDRLGQQGAWFAHAFAPAPITLTSHASILTGRYPVGHLARHNGVLMDGEVPTLAVTLKAAGFRTGAFVSAFPLDKRFGLARGFDVYDDRTPRGADGRRANERPGADTVAAALEWVRARSRATRAESRAPNLERLFLWVHLFEPHAPYEGDPSRPAIARYDEEIARADALVGRLLDGLGPLAADAMVVVAGDHGEAFGEHGETGHSIFVYDTTLRVPLVIAGPGIAPGRRVPDAVSLVDLAPTILAQLAVAPMPGMDGVDLGPTLAGRLLGSRLLYAESFAPLIDFGWAPLRAVRAEGWKYIAAPRPELYHVAEDSGEQANLAVREPTRAAALAARADRYGDTELARDRAAADREAAERLRALGYAAGAPAQTRSRPDPKDRIDIASALAQVTSGEVRGAAAERRLEEVLRQDRTNAVAHVRLGVLLEERGRCDLATPHLQAAITAAYPSADPAIALAACRERAGQHAAAIQTLAASRRVEPGNPVVEANIGVIEMEAGRTAEAVATLREAVRLDPDFLEARFNLVRALARAGRRDEARTEVAELLRRLPADAPQRGETARLQRALD